MSDKVLIELDEALAWVRGERRLRVPMPDGSWSEMSVNLYRDACETQDRLRAYRGRLDAKPVWPDARP